MNTITAKKLQTIFASATDMQNSDRKEVNSPAFSMA